MTALNKHSLSQNHLDENKLFFLVPQRIDGQFNIPATAAVIDPNCVDKIPSCWNLPDDNCKAPYEDWAREYCGNRCGYCKGLPTPAPACEDNLPNCADYDISVCSDTNYRSWANLNCRFFCRLEFCSDCFDKVDCRQYDMSVCGDQYKLWASENCPLHCGTCTGVTTPLPPCVDTIPNCKDYPLSTCTEPSFKLWVEDNCRKYCGICE
ncbi:hypothetical protein MAR_015474 [Mya arenaria]|uniref:ShKT domain-containing protein n=1 Tax=Mya arenaria TaxID=6604 RepID=A0ABY7FH32_MYAAR|nr:hypothetical protein MAR_015474 [Mya arenaria]